MIKTNKFIVRHENTSNPLVIHIPKDWETDLNTGNNYFHDELVEVDKEFSDKYEALKTDIAQKTFELKSMEDQVVRKKRKQKEDKND